MRPRHPRGRPIVMAMMNLRLADPAMLIDIARIAELTTSAISGDTIESGAAVTQNTLLAWPDLKQKLPLLAVALPSSGISQTRKRVRSAARSQLRSELGNPAVACHARRRSGLRGPQGERVLKGQGLSARHADHRARGRRADRRGALSGAHRTRRAFREVARRHGRFRHGRSRGADHDKGSIRLGVGGMAGTPVVRVFPTGGAKDSIEKLATELEGYGPHARRNCAATSCAIWHRS